MPLPLFNAASDPARQKAHALAAAARALASTLLARQPITRKSLGQHMARCFGCTDADGAWSMRDAYDALEAAQVITCLKNGGALLGHSPAETLAQVRELADRLPTQRYRTERQVALQQFSTPLPLAWLASQAAMPTVADIVLEPSAGTGLLALHAKCAGAALQLNERDPVRAYLLSEIMGMPVTSHDAEYIDTHLAALPRPDLILINPPFVRSEGRGDDRHAGARHLRSALQRLADHGRCVAIMPSGFCADGSGATGYQAVANLVPPRLEITLVGQPFARHGTSIAVRLLLYDRNWTGIAQREALDCLDDALEVVLSLPARQMPVRPMPPAEMSLISSAPIRLKPGQRPLMLGQAKIRTPAAPKGRTAIDSAPRPLDYAVLEAPNPAGDQIGIYVPWRLSRIAIPGATPHPDSLVESIAMSSILPPVPSYTPMLPPCAVAALSDAQIETVIYAGQAFERDLPGLHAPDSKGTFLSPDATGKAYRMGYFLGDGTGVGKGQQVAACILDRWCRGQRKAVWISKSSALIEDARRDWAALGGLPIDIQPLDAFPLGTPISMESGILFMTYATLRSQRHDEASRLSQILAWLGADFDGLLCYDEAHEMANAAGTQSSFGKQKGSEQGLAGVRLQNLLPRACVLYVSATGATDPANLCYAIRLGLWGPGTAFESRAAFMTAIADGGIAAMEIVARDLKALGLYTARALTFRGVEYEPLEHVLTLEQIAIYNAYADGWAIIHKNLEQVLMANNIVDRMTGKALNAQAKGSALSRFESAKQRFFSQVLVAMKLPTLVAAIEAELDADHQVIVQLVTTAEAMLDRRLASLSADDAAHLDIELSPREAMIDYLQTAFPTRMMTVFKGSDGYDRSELMVDADGNAVHCAEAIARRDELIERLCALPAIGMALDDIIARFGTDRVAEVTGRSRRLILDGNGRQKIERRSARSNIVEAQAFMAGSKPILIFSDAGGTGRSYHADRNCPSAHRRRIHFLLEPGWRASNAIQGLGRSNRTNQMSAPVFRPVTTNCKGERRFISTIARRLDSLGALTRGQRQTGGQNLFDPADNLESDYAKDALRQWYSLLFRGKLTSTSLADFIAMTGLKLLDEDGGGLLDDLPPIHRWLNRLLALRIETQDAIFDEYMALIQARIDEARDAGTLDVGVETIMTERIVVLEETLLRQDPATGAETRLARLELHHRRKALAYARLMTQWGQISGNRMLRNEKSGRVALATPSWPVMNNEGEPIRMWMLVRPTGQERIRDHRLAESAWVSSAPAEFERLWHAEVDEAAAKIDIETIHLATGLLLPVWNKLPDDDVRVWRVSDAAGNSLLGRIVSPSGVEKVGKAFGVAMTLALTPADMLRAVQSGETLSVPGLGDAEMARVRVNDATRLEIRNFPPGRREWLKSLGCFTEIIAYKTRLFVPTDRAETILRRIAEAGVEYGKLVAMVDGPT
ncbi:methyltransferase domain protein [Sphingobium sp. RAC03]|nr:methyltransferase domain protein [Sphingobium sp. RAC03]